MHQPRERGNSGAARVWNEESQGHDDPGSGQTRGRVVVLQPEMVERALEEDVDEPSDEIDLTLIDWFLTLSPWERLQASAN